MPRPGQVPSPAVRRGEELPQGSATEVESLLAALPLPPEEDLAEDVPEDAFTPSGPEERYLFGPSERPGEPITAGAPFGPGPSVPSIPGETEGQFLDRVANTLEAEGSSVPGVRGYISRIRRGF